MRLLLISGVLVAGSLWGQTTARPSGIYNTTAPAPANGQAVPFQSDQAGNLRTFVGSASATGSAWTSGTALNATQTIFSNSGAGSALVHLVQTTTITAGAITFEVSYDNTNWVTAPADAVVDPASTFAQISLPYTLVASTNKPFLIKNRGWMGLRIKLSTQISGSGSVTPNYTLINERPGLSVVALSPTATNHKVAVFGNAGAVFDGATGAAPPANVLYLGGRTSGATGGLLASPIYCDQYANIQQTSNTQIITGVASRRIYICSVNLVVGAAQNVAIVAGTGSVCATTTVAVPGTSGGATAATGWNLAANSGIVIGGGANAGPVAKTTVDADNVCVFQSGSAQVSGAISYAIL